MGGTGNRAGNANMGNPLSVGNILFICLTLGLQPMILNSPGAKNAILNGIGKPFPHDCPPSPATVPLQSFFSHSSIFLFTFSSNAHNNGILRLIENHHSLKVSASACFKNCPNCIFSEPTLFNIVCALLGQSIWLPVIFFIAFVISFIKF